MLRTCTKKLPYLATVTSKKVYDKNAFDPDPIIKNKSVLTWDDMVTNVPTKNAEDLG
jgi:hypothetical protein